MLVFAAELNWLTNLIYRFNLLVVTCFSIKSLAAGLALKCLTILGCLTFYFL